MPTKVIQVPSDIILKVPQVAGEDLHEEFSFSKFVQALLSQPSWGKDYKSVRAGAAIDTAVSSVSDGIVVLSEEDWRMLKESAESPGGGSGYGLHPYLLRQLLPFFDAILRAEEK